MKKYLHALNLIPELGPSRLGKIIDYFPSLAYAWHAPQSAFIKCGLDRKTVASILALRPDINPDEEWEYLEKNKIQVISELPQKLIETGSSPAILYAKGNPELLKKPSIGVVGSRKMTDYGLAACRQISLPLIKAGLVIVSGLATGIDATAHQAALDADGPTIAVLGSGINENVIFPAGNRPLARNIINKGGLVISEYPPQTKAARPYFPARNRIISGLSLATIVIEAERKSGALITAFKALEQNREVFTVPGSIFSQKSDGTNYLLKKGAMPVLSGQEILDELHLTPSEDAHPPRNLTLDEQKIINVLSGEPLHIDKIIKQTRLNPNIAVSLLTNMELDEIITNLGNNKFIKNI
ncbi:DNA-processing protein DprA [Patescibacteria group bacterium]|nr:DNA-processing protein DprA [Patescibacteria group bacterium]MBU1672978.1 DNA-processing protein DprA [Patescibacteria group bacterium]MBU1962987.1 DNA-processing protein DprA [Patescibacteria group bacterium]